MTSPVEPVILGVGKLNAGTTYNALAETAVLEGTTRTASQESRERMQALVGENGPQYSAVYGGSVELQWTDCAAPLINAPLVCREAAAVAGPLFGQILTDRPLSLSGDNFAEYLLHVPGAYVDLGTGNPALPNTMSPGHNGDFNIDEDTLILGAKLHADYAVSVLTGTPRRDA